MDLKKKKDVVRIMLCISPGQCDLCLSSPVDPRRPSVLTRAEETWEPAASSSSERYTITLADTFWVGFKEVKWRESVRERETPPQPHSPKDE